MKKISIMVLALGFGLSLSCDKDFTHWSWGSGYSVNGVGYGAGGCIETDSTAIGIKKSYKDGRTADTAYYRFTFKVKDRGGIAFGDFVRLYLIGFDNLGDESKMEYIELYRNVKSIEKFGNKKPKVRRDNRFDEWEAERAERIRAFDSADAKP